MSIKADLHTHTCRSFDGRQTLEQLIAAAKAKGLEAPVAGQYVYNLLNRGIENEVVSMLQRFDMGLTTFNPLGGGMLTGKYRRGQAAPAAPAGNALVIGGENAIAGEDITYTYTATEAGTLTIEVRGPKFMSILEYLNVSYSVNGGAAVDIAVAAVTEIALNAGDVVTITVEANCQGMVNASWAAAPGQ